MNKKYHRIKLNGISSSIIFFLIAIFIFLPAASGFAASDLELSYRLEQMDEMIYQQELKIQAADADMNIKTTDKKALEAELAAMKLEKAGIEKQLEQQKSISIKEWAQRVWKWAQEKGASAAFWSAMKGALNKIASDAGTWVGSGGKGQSAMFFKDGFGPYLTKIADETAGQFIENLGKNGPVKFNLCNPDFAVTMKIGLGLVQYTRPKAPACTFSKMKQNWEKELQSKDFLTKFQDMFNPVSNDVGIALSFQTNIMQQQKLNVGMKEKDRQEAGGWLDVRSLISDKKESVPRYGDLMVQQSLDLQTANMGRYTGEAFTDAANIFLNQLAITLFQRFLATVGKENGDSGESSPDQSGLFDVNASSGNNGGIKAVKAKLRKVIEPKFDVRGDYNILNELAQCPNPTKAGPTNCVLDEKFRQAIEEKVTVGEALDNGYLKSNGPFGFLTSGNMEPNYMEGYPYRSLIILRKFRILPVGWEVAAQRIRDNQSNGTRNMGDLVACFDPDDEYRGYNDDGSQFWCQGLIDPNWVLKAPLNYCRRQGPGPEILSESVSGAGANSVLNITRNDSYCADEQSCIKENDDGSCQFYGYCTEERRRWKFGSNSCEPKFNTCQTFKSEDGRTASYLENSLDYRGCSIDNAGCLGYCYDYNYAAGNYNNCTPTSVGNKIYLDNGVKECDQKNEGCHEFVRTKIGLGANLLLNSSFEDDLSIGGWSGIAAGTSTASYDGLSSLELRVGLQTKTATTAAEGYNIGAVNGDVFTLSFYSSGCAASSTFKVDTTQPGEFDIATGAGWQLNKATYIVDNSVYGNVVTLNFDSDAAGCLIDAVKLERSYEATAYNSYLNNTKVHEKLLPDYLQPVCYDASWNLLSNAPAECEDYARICREEEVGCELFTSAEDKMAVPAKVGAQNYCVPECVGFKSYLATETYFDSLRQENFIPKTAKSCSAASVGCDEFTNLDQVAAGGEAVENYTYLRQCVKPDSIGSNCNEFYTWEGSNESGFQLRVMSLNATALLEPAITDTTTDSNNCTETIYNLAATDPGYNSDCREFYNTNGIKSWHLYSLTVSCDEDCHPYRRTEVNIDPSITESDCVGADMNWADHDGNSAPDCALCKNGGEWSPDHGACIYDAIPSQGRVCKASAVGCREYTGSSGRNIRVILNNNFEDGTQQNWIGGSLSNESIIVGGRSLLSAAQVYKDVTNIVQPEKSYILSFIAKSDGATTLEARFTNSAGSSTGFGLVPSSGNLSGDWQVYELNLARIDHDLSDSANVENLFIIGTGGQFYIDNIKLTEIVNRYYLIKQNPWNTPEVCDSDLSGNASPGYMLGCEEYTDRDRQTHYLRSFAYLCSESAVGCEMMIDTMNSSNPLEEEFNTDNTAATEDPTGIDDITIPEDDYVYAVFDKEKQCNSDDKGCQRLGKPYSYDGDILYSDIYLKNNPDEYPTAMCTLDAANCGKYSSADGTSYFKNPGDQVCEWRQGYQLEWGWYKKKINRCDTDSDGTGDGDVCISDNDCTSPEKCLKEGNSDIPCDVSNFKTFGFGENLVDQPGQDASGDYWVGLCSADDAGCSELIDPMSQFSNNLIYNYDFSQGSGASRYGWTGNQQQVKTDQNTLYRLAGRSNLSGSFTVTCPGNISIIDENNNLVPSGVSRTLALDPASMRSVLFYSDSNDQCILNISALPGSAGIAEVELKKVVVNYQKKQGLDAKTCNGVVDFNDGCVLFNQRSQNGLSLSVLNYDAETSISAPNTINPIDDTVDSNKLLKVSPDRVCDKWLACKSQLEVKNEKGQKENSCLDIGLCNSVDANGNCDNFLFVDTQNQSVAGTNLANGQSINNLSGLTKVGASPDDYYNYSAMTQQGNLAEVSNGNFELAGSEGYPYGWSAMNTEWKSSYFKIISNPYDMQKEGINQAPDGRGFLKAGISKSIISEQIDVSDGTEYILSFYYNTYNLSEGNAVLNIVDGDNPSTIISSMTLAFGKDWQLANVRFEPNSSKIKIIIASVAGATKGNYYIDDIKIAPSLNYKNNSYAAQSCRLYPEDTALSCNYLDESGINQKGWLGYCLEYDRFPGGSNACLSWWPVDRVNGNGIVGSGDFGGYGGKTPLYYCAELDGDFVLVENRKGELINYTEQTSWGGPLGFIGEAWSTLTSFIPFNQYIDPILLVSGNDSYEEMFDIGDNGAGFSQDCPTNHGYRYDVQTATDEDWFTETVKVWTYCNPSARMIAPSQNSSDGSGWYEFNGSLIKWTNRGNRNRGAKRWEIDYGLKIYEPSTGELYNPNEYLPKCKSFFKTTSDLGQNKAWLGRVSEGSTYQVQSLDYTYQADDEPFGSAVPPAPANNPYEWDGNYQAGIQQISINSEDSGMVRAGSPYSCDGQKCDNFGQCSISKQLCFNPRCDGADCNWIINGNYTYKNAITTFEACSNPASSIASCVADGGREFGWELPDTPMQCPKGEFCDEALMNLELSSTRAQAADLASRIFAKNYGTYVWGGEAGFCQGGTASGTACEQVGNQCPGGFCNSGCRILSASGASMISSSTPPNNCMAQPNPDAFCVGTVNSRIMNPYKPAVTMAALNVAGFNDCVPINIACGGGNPYPSCCSMTSDPVACATALNGLDPATNLCRYTNTQCSSNNDCLYNAVCQYDSCSGGTKAGSACSSEQTCPSGQCIPTAADYGRYLPTNDNKWDVPTTICPGLIRPAYPADYCGIPPVVTNIKVNNTAGPSISINRNGLVNLTFNSTLDKNQLPLVGYTVDWGDNEVSTVSGIESNDKQDATNPHSLYHIYDYYNLRSKFDSATVADPTSIECPAGLDYCRAKPKVMVQDNWGWCNEGATTNMCNSTGPMTVFSTMSATDHWEEFAGEIRVYEN